MTMCGESRRIEGKDVSWGGGGGKGRERYERA